MQAKAQTQTQSETLTGVHLIAFLGTRSLRLPAETQAGAAIRTMRSSARRRVYRFSICSHLFPLIAGTFQSENPASTKRLTASGPDRGVANLPALARA